MDGTEHDRDTSDGVRSDLVRGGLWTVVSALVGVPLSIISNIVLARGLGVDDLGTYGQIVVLWSIGSMIVNAGVSSAAMQWMARARGRGARVEYLHVVRICGSYHVLFQAPVLAVLALWLTHEAGVWVAILAGSAALIEQTLGTASVVMSGSGRNARAAQIGIIAAAVKFVILIGAVALSDDPVVIWAAVAVVGALIGVLHWRSITPEERREIPSLRGTRPLPAGFVAFSVNVGIIAVSSNLVFGRSEVLVLGAYSQNYAAGLFVVATAIAGLVTVPLDSMLGPLAPAASFFTGRSRDQAADVLERAVRISGVLAGASASAAPAGIAVIVPLMYGDSFSGAVLSAQALTIVSLLQSVLNPMTTFTLATGRSGGVLALSLVSATVNLGLAFALVPRWGLAGAVVASAVGQLTHLVGAAELAARITASSRSRLALRSAPLGIGIGIGLGGALLVTLGPDHGALEIASAICVSCGGFALFRAVLTWARPLGIPVRDWDSMSETLGRRTAVAARVARRLLGESVTDEKL